MLALPSMTGAAEPQPLWPSGAIWVTVIVQPSQPGTTYVTLVVGAWRAVVASAGFAAAPPTTVAARAAPTARRRRAVWVLGIGCSCRARRRDSPMGAVCGTCLRSIADGTDIRGRTRKLPGRGDRRAVSRSAPGRAR